MQVTFVAISRKSTQRPKLTDHSWVQVTIFGEIFVSRQSHFSRSLFYQKFVTIHRYCS